MGDLFKSISFTSFKSTFDIPGQVILLEGKRKVKSVDESKLEALGSLLALHLPKAVFRSGNADGADFHFCKGVYEVAPGRIQVITPYSGHRSKLNLAYQTIALDTIYLPEDSQVVYQTKKNKLNQKLIDQFIAGKKDKYAIKAAYLLRDTVKVIGAYDIPKANVALFYDDLNKPKSGGTGHTMKICEMNQVPYYTQEQWFKWLEENSLI